MVKSGAFLVTRLIGVPPEKGRTLAQVSVSRASRPHRLHRRSLAVFTVLTALAAACGGGDGNPGAATDAGFTTMGMPGVPSPTRVGAHLVFAAVSVARETRHRRAQG